MLPKLVFLLHNNTFGLNCRSTQHRACDQDVPEYNLHATCQGQNILSSAYGTQRTENRVKGLRVMRISKILSRGISDGGRSLIFTKSEAHRSLPVLNRLDFRTVVDIVPVYVHTAIRAGTVIKEDFLETLDCIDQ